MKGLVLVVYVLNNANAYLLGLTSVYLRSIYM